MKYRQGLLIVLQKTTVRICLSEVSMQHHLIVNHPREDGDMSGEGTTVRRGNQNGKWICLDEGDCVRVVANPVEFRNVHVSDLL
jgi:ribosomal silencing factor RsfS